MNICTIRKNNTYPMQVWNVKNYFLCLYVKLKCWPLLKAFTNLPRHRKFTHVWIFWFSYTCNIFVVFLFGTFPITATTTPIKLLSIPSIKRTMLICLSKVLFGSFSSCQVAWQQPSANMLQIIILSWNKLFFIFLINN